MIVPLTVILLAGCGDSTASGRVSAQTTGVNDVLQSAMASEDSKNAAEESISGDSQTTMENETSVSTADDSDTGGADIDLTELSSNMVYATVFDMLYEPEMYVGKVVKMEGTFNSLYAQEYDRYLFACIISDATACCSQGIEFIPADGYRYPDDFPEAGGNVTVTGVFEILEEDGEKYVALTDARML